MTRRRKSETAARAGFTLLEMLVSMAILALVAVFAMPLLSGPSDGLRLEATARELLGALRLTRVAAVARDAELALVIDVDGRTFESPAVPRRSFAPDIAAQLTFAEPEQSARSRGGFRFFPDGSSTGGDVVLRLHGREAKICVDWLTGAAGLGAEC
jgi:general secretion pathway protein H